MRSSRKMSGQGLDREVESSACCLLLLLLLLLPLLSLFHLKKTNVQPDLQLTRWSSTAPFLPLLPTNLRYGIYRYLSPLWLVAFLLFRHVYRIIFCPTTAGGRREGKGAGAGAVAAIRIERRVMACVDREQASQIKRVLVRQVDT